MTRTARVADRTPGSAAEAGTLRALEYAVVTAELATLTAFAPSRELALATVPSADAALVEILQDQTDEATRLLEDQAQASIGGTRDVRAALERARRGGRLQVGDLIDLSETLGATARFATRLKAWKGPHLSGIRDELDDAPELRSRIERTVDEAGEILDSASPELAAIRKRLRTAQDRVRDRLNAMLRSSEMVGVIGEAIVTLRGGRYVIPIRAEAKGKLKGIIHDQSASGATVFVEPLSVVELNNTWTQATLDAAREEERILDELSRLVEARSEALLASLIALARADLWMARARLGQQQDGVRPTIAADAAELLSARHPLLGAAAVPIDLRLGARFGYRALVITGPNTGGKTVALKTLGLLALMHQSGLRVPAADGARLPVYRSVMADIGDEQSIAQSLSTFSSHLRNVIHFTETADEKALVLLDEIGAGTDPTEGSALAMAIIDRLLTSGANLAATTHYAELKAFAQQHPLVTNASVAFDVATLRPTYRLEIGLPGKSQAFAIAERLGLAADILADARARLAVEHVSMEAALADIARASTEQAAELDRARHDRSAATAELQRVLAGRERARREAGEMLADARRAADELLARAEREAADLRREVARRKTTRARGSAPDAIDQLVTRAQAARAEIAPMPGAASETELLETQPRVGLRARSRTLGSSGMIVEISGRTGRVTLETDEARIVVPGDDVEVVAEPAYAAPEPATAAAELQRRAAGQIAPRLDLRGERVEAALEMLDAYLDQALLAGLDEAVVLHGSGTGALRRVVRERLADHPRVRGVRPGRRDEGGDGATVAQL